MKLINLFNEFVKTYPFTPNGIAHISAHNEQQKQGRHNFHWISETAESGQDITEYIIPKLLLHQDSMWSQKKGAWIHTSPSIHETSDILFKFEDPWFIPPSNYSDISEAIFKLIQQCNTDPSQLSKSCITFSESFSLKYFSAEIITPILNALKPNDFLIVGRNSRLVINHFANTDFSPKLTDYPSANATAKQLINKLAKEMQQPGVPAMQEGDLFDMFCYWLVAVKKYDFSAPTLSTLNKIPEEPIELIPKILQPEYTLAECAAKTGIIEELLQRWNYAINRKKQAILQGPPGTGKTYLAKQIAKHLIGGGDGFMELVQFHPAYCYEDFIQGIRPQANEHGQLDYPVVPGRFLEFCKKAESCEDTCVLIIDEINRGNLSSVFGELMYLLEYRDEKIPLAGSNELFGIPENVRIIGTMNTADRSIALVDHALRRRFAFIELRPNYEILRRYHEREATDFPVDGLIATLQRVNQVIDDPDYELGISFFLLPDLADQIEDVWRMEIEPYLEEYFFDQRDKLEPFRWEAIAKTILPKP
jgi:5-methylcytosine-specific restriction protein B